MVVTIWRSRGGSSKYKKYKSIKNHQKLCYSMFQIKRWTKSKELHSKSQTAKLTALSISSNVTFNKITSRNTTAKLQINGEIVFLFWGKAPAAHRLVRLRAISLASHFQRQTIVFKKKSNSTESFLQWLCNTDICLWIRCQKSERVGLDERGGGCVANY